MYKDVSWIRLTRGQESAKGSGDDSTEPSVSIKDKEFTHLWFKLQQHYVTTGPSVRAVYGRSPAGIVGSNPTGGMDVCLL